MLRPLMMEYPQDAKCRDITDEFMVGSCLLAAPVLTPGVTARAVYLPKGIWFDYYTGKRYRGGKYVLADAPIDRMPLFAKAGAIFPVSAGNPQSTAEIDKIELEVFPGNGSFVHYSDDGESMDYQTGKLHRLQIKVRGKRVTQTVLQDGFEAPAQLKVRWMAE